MKYLATVTASFEIEAENVMQARLVAARCRAIGEVIGSRKPEKNRDAIRYRCERVGSKTEIRKLEDR